MNWSDLVGVRVQLPPPNQEVGTGAPAPEPAAPEPAPAAQAAQAAPARKSTRAAKADGARENPLFAGAAQPDPPDRGVAAGGAAGRGYGGDGGAVVSSLLTVPALMNITFSTTAITLLWKLLQRWFGSAAGQWVPLVLCLSFVGISWLASYATARTSAVTKAVTALVALLTGLILTAAVIGIDTAVLGSGS